MVRLTLTSPFPEGTGSRRGGVPFGGVISLHASNIAHATPSSDFIERWVVKLAYCTFRKKGLMASNALIVPPEARPNHHHQQQPTHCPVPDCVQHGNPYHAREQILHQRYRKGIASAFAFPSPEAIDCCNGKVPVGVARMWLLDLAPTPAGANVINYRLQYFSVHRCRPADATVRPRHNG